MSEVSVEVLDGVQGCQNLPVVGGKFPLCPRETLAGVAYRRVSPFHLLGEDRPSGQRAGVRV